jgi:hypothetical protein
LEGGDSFLSCDTQKKFWKSAKIHSITQHLRHEDLVKTKLFNYIVKRAWIKLSIRF